MSAPVVAAAAVAATALAGTGGWLIYTSTSTASSTSTSDAATGGRSTPGRATNDPAAGAVVAAGSRAAGFRAAGFRAVGRRSGPRFRSSQGGTSQVGRRFRPRLDLRDAAPGAVRIIQGVGGPSPWELSMAVAVVGAAAAVGAWLLFGGVIPAVVAGLFAATFPVAGHRRRAQDRLAAAVEEWPRLLEEIRLRTGSLGRSVPQALFEAGRSVPSEWRPVFEAAEREWLLTIDFARTVGILKQGLSDPTADAVCETLLMAHEIGGTDLDAKLADLIEDRTLDLQSRRDATSRLAGVRFARRFVLLVPLGMALAGLTIGTGRHAYQTAGGQLAVVIGLVAVAACWWWSGRLMRVPGAPRVFP